MTEVRDVSVDFKGGYIKTQGIAKLNRAMVAAGKDAEDNRELMFRLGSIVADEAKSLAPVRSGALRDAIRAGRGKTKAVVRAGFRSVPYAPVIHYGWADHGIEAQPYLLQALQNKRAEVIQVFEQGIRQLTDKHFGKNTSFISGD
jgi:hypothetical protein